MRRTVLVLSSAIHVTWADAAGTRLGVGNDSTYNNPRCFDAFPFPTPPQALRAQIAALGERIDKHRTEALTRDSRVTATGMYNVITKLRAHEEMSAKEQDIFVAGACGVLRDLHDQLDALVAEAYGWSWPEPPALVLERLVALHDARVDDERRGVVRWLRPEFQVPKFGQRTRVKPGEIAFETAPTEPVGRKEWPKTVIEQIAALKALTDAGPVSVEEAAARFTGARRDLVARHLDTLALMGELQRMPDGRYEELAVPV